ncbi:unnamed protein product [Auanema sp. JU1783]|nr:unnamed protein product [Auanema sp. JU1783]
MENKTGFQTNFLVPNITFFSRQAVTVKDVANLQSLKNRWSNFPGYNSRLTLRTPLEISLAFSQPDIETNLSDFYLNVTSLDLSSMNLNKLTGIEALPNLVNLSLKNNRFCSIKKLKILENLEFLDASCNKILRADQLPIKLKHLNLSQNHLVSLQFCIEVQDLEVLNVSRNQIKSLKGLENCVNLQVLIANDNQLKDKLEVDNMKNCSKLTYIDFVRNKLTSLDGYRARLLMQFPLLSALDRENIPVEDRILSFNKSGRGLTLEVLKKKYPNLDEITKISMVEQKLEIIVLDEPCLNKMNQITELDLSRNQFENVKKLGYLSNLRKLNLSKNHIKLLWSQSKVDEAEDVIPFSQVEVLDISGNELNSSLLSLIGLQYFQSLKKLILNDNLLTLFDSSVLDLPYLEEVHLQRNLLKTIKRKCLNQLNSLDISYNRLKDINGLVCPNLKTLNIAHNSITTCSALKPICDMKILQNLDCSANPVISHRVYLDFIKTQAASIDILDTKQISAYVPIDKRRLSAVNLEHEKERNESLSSHSFLEWEDTLLTPKSESYDFVLRPRSFGNHLSVNGIKMTKHRKSFGS